MMTICVGSPVRLCYGGKGVPGTVIEDRGPIGVNGRRLWRVRVEIEPPVETEVPETELEVDRCTGGEP